MIQIGRIGKGTKVHMHIDGKTCGAGRGARITETIASDMLQWCKPAELCKRCFTGGRMERASQINAYGHGWSQSLEAFLIRVPAARELQVERTSAERLEEIRTQLRAALRANGTLMTR